MKAFILAAGKGTRLNPLNSNLPKPLIKTKGKPLILWNIEKLRDSGINDIVINLFHKGEQIKEFLGDGSEYGVKIQYSEEDELLGTGGGIGNSLSLLGEGVFLLISADVWTDLDLNKIVLEKPKSAHLILKNNPKEYPEGDLSLQGGLVKDSAEPLRLTFSGIALIDPCIFNNIKEKHYGLWESVLKPACSKDFVTGELYEGTMFNVNTPEDIEKLDALLNEE
jgi:MurNAc alpha-1-phosphate uridylyltransferase